jgi:hypothetical protein
MNSWRRENEICMDTERYSLKSNELSESFPYLHSGEVKGDWKMEKRPLSNIPYLP